MLLEEPIPCYHEVELLTIGIAKVIIIYITNAINTNIMDV